jgi:hypothetical protein
MHFLIAKWLASVATACTCRGRARSPVAYKNVSFVTAPGMPGGSTSRTASTSGV